MTRDEFEQTCRVRRLQIGDTIKEFDCGDEDLNDFLLNESSLYRNALLSVTYVVENKQTNDVMAYFTLSNDKISISDFESKTDFNRFRKHKFVNEKKIEELSRHKNWATWNCKNSTTPVNRHISS